jgi:hypothetical protein
VLIVEPFVALGGQTRTDLLAEGERLIRFVAGATKPIEVRFAEIE